MYNNYAISSLPQMKISKGNANEVVKQTKRLTQGVAEKEINTADIAFVADIIDRVLNAGAISSVGWSVRNWTNKMTYCSESGISGVNITGSGSSNYSGGGGNVTNSGSGSSNGNYDNMVAVGFILFVVVVTLIVVVIIIW